MAYRENALPEIRPVTDADAIKCTIEGNYTNEEYAANRGPGLPSRAPGKEPKWFVEWSGGRLGPFFDIVGDRISVDPNGLPVFLAEHHDGENVFNCLHHGNAVYLLIEDDYCDADSFDLRDGKIVFVNGEFLYWGNEKYGPIGNSYGFHNGRLYYFTPEGAFVFDGRKYVPEDHVWFKLRMFVGDWPLLQDGYDGHASRFRLIFGNSFTSWFKEEIDISIIDGQRVRFEATLAEDGTRVTGELTQG